MPPSKHRTGLIGGTSEMPVPCSGRSRAAADDDGDLRLYLTGRTVEAANVSQLAMRRRIRWNAITVFREASVLKDFC